MMKRAILIVVSILWTDIAMAQQEKSYYRDSMLWEEVTGGVNRHTVSLPKSVDESLPNVLLIGTSISIGYTLPVREQLKGIANVYRIPANSFNTDNGLEKIEFWLSDMEWDVIHMNWGLHDLKYTQSDDQQDVPPARYRENLRKILTYVKEHSPAKIIWAQTTYVPSDVEPRRDMGDDKLYNDIALEVVGAFNDIVVDDHYKLTSENQQLQQPHNVHFSPEGYNELAKQVCSYIKAALK